MSQSLERDVALADLGDLGEAVDLILIGGASIAAGIAIGARMESKKLNSMAATVSETHMIDSLDFMVASRVMREVSSRTTKIVLICLGVLAAKHVPQILKGFEPGP